MRPQTDEFPTAIQPDRWRATITPFGGDEFVAAEFEYEQAAREFLWCLLNMINSTEHKVAFCEFLTEGEDDVLDHVIVKVSPIACTSHTWILTLSKVDDPFDPPIIARGASYDWVSAHFESLF
jgi:hypothetical protein